MNRPIIKNYDVTIKQVVKENITIGMISDLHLGTRKDKHVLEELLNNANQIPSDVFILAGDIFDEFTSDELKEEAYDKFSQIKTKYGVFYIEGNHDMLSNDTRQKLLEHNIEILDDKVVSIEDKFYLIGRKDLRRDKLNQPRESLEKLMDLVKKEIPVILIDHQPVDHDLAKTLGVDLQLSGHTHGGQIFPGNVFLQHGYKKENDFHSIVTNGYGVWGFPIRTAGRSEMLHITLKN